MIILQYDEVKWEISYVCDRSTQKDDSNTRSIRVESTTTKVASPCKMSYYEKLEVKGTENVFNKIDAVNDMKINNKNINKHDTTKKLDNETTAGVEQNTETIQIKNNGENKSSNIFDKDKLISKNNITPRNANKIATSNQNITSINTNKTATKNILPTNLNPITTSDTYTTTRGDALTGHKNSHEPTKMSVHERLNIWKNKEEAVGILFLLIFSWWLFFYY